MLVMCCPIHENLDLGKPRGQLGPWPLGMNCKQGLQGCDRGRGSATYIAMWSATHSRIC